MTDKQIQVWITSSPDADFLQSLKPKIHRNDIVLLYSQQTKSLSLIGGYRLQDFSLPHQFLHPVERQEVNYHRQRRWLEIACT